MARRLDQLYKGKCLAKQYVKYRPTYTTAMFETIYMYYEAGKGPTCNRDLALDVGCGSGQTTLPLVQYFRHVIGCDVSKDQLRHAPRNTQKVTFKECASENLYFLQRNSTDMVTSGMAFHWFDAGLFYKESRRVLKPGGVLALFAYGWPEIANKEAHILYQEHTLLMQETDVVDYSNGPNAYKHMYERYSLPFPEWKRIESKAELDIRKNMTASDLVGFAQTFHTWWLYLEKNPNSNHLKILQSKMEAALGGENTKVDVTLPVVLLLGRKPVE